MDQSTDQTRADVGAAFERLHNRDCRAAGLPCTAEAPGEAIFAGAFNPLHDGHRRMAALAEELLGASVEFEISIENVDKPPLELHEIQARVEQFEPHRTIWLTRAPTFAEKVEIFPGATFVVGADTIARIAAPRYYANDIAAAERAVETIASAGCRFLVFGRLWLDGFKTIEEIDLGQRLRAICRQVPENKFRMDISSTDLRGR
jgi:hypothetical protein